MVWWLHLVIRRADPLESRCKVFERVVRAVGSYSYAERSVPLLLRITLIPHSYLSYQTVNTIIHRGYDLPAEIWTSSLQWVRAGVNFRTGNPCCIVWRCICKPVTNAFFYWHTKESVEFNCLKENIHFNKMWETTKPRQDHVSGKTP